MRPIINIENLRRFAYCNNAVCKRPIRGLVLCFYGLGGADMYEEERWEGQLYGDQGILFLVPYQNPWAWMNKQTVAFTDELNDVLFAAYDLPADLPIVSTGGSMGGQSALVYTAYAKRTPAACVANCPVCDLPYHFTERPDLPRTLYSAFGGYEGTLEEALQTASPLHLIDRMPTGTAYTIIHCGADEGVNIHVHSERFVAEMEKDHTVAYYIDEGRGHCDLSEEMGRRYYESIIAAVERGSRL